jgi:hypothetical protein
VDAPRRATAVRLARRGYIALGCVWLFVALTAVVTLAL